MKGFKQVVCCVATTVVALGVSQPLRAEMLVEVDGRSGPWEWVNGGLNTDYQYNEGPNDQLAPTIVSENLAAGIAMRPGDTLTISFASGSWSAGAWMGAGSYTDANGYTSPPHPSFPDFVRDTPADAVFGGGKFPGYYAPASEFPMNWMTLVGVFTDSEGSIIGSPHVIGNNRTLPIPLGAARFQLGADDGVYYDNGGSIMMHVVEVPEPAAISLFIVGGLWLLVHVCRSRQRAS